MPVGREAVSSVLDGLSAEFDGDASNGGRECDPMVGAGVLSDGLAIASAERYDLSFSCGFCCVCDKSRSCIFIEVVGVFLLTWSQITCRVRLYLFTCDSSRGPLSPAASSLRHSRHNSCSMDM
jgi:hypothetical protein